MKPNFNSAMLILVSCATLSISGCANQSSFKSLFRADTIENPEPIPLTIWHDSFETALRESETSGKPILADFTGSDWCSYCVKLKKEVFDTAQFKVWARDNVVLLELDYPKRSSQNPEIKKQNAELAKRYNIKSYPTVLFLDSAATVLGKTGYASNPDQWISTAESLLKKNESP